MGRRCSGKWEVAVAVAVAVGSRQWQWQEAVAMPDTRYPCPENSGQ